MTASKWSCSKLRKERCLRTKASASILRQGARQKSKDHISPEANPHKGSPCVLRRLVVRVSSCQAMSCSKRAVAADACDALVAPLTPDVQLQEDAPSQIDQDCAKIQPPQARDPDKKDTACCMLLDSTAERRACSASNQLDHLISKGFSMP